VGGDEYTTVTKMIDLILIASFIAGVILFVKHMQRLDAEIGMMIAKHQHMESNTRGVVLFWVEPRGLFRYVPQHRFISNEGMKTMDAPPTIVERQIVPPSREVHLDALFILSESIKRNPGGRQFMRIGDFHTDFAQRWRNATDYLSAEWGVIKHSVGQGIAGTFLPSDYNTLEDLQTDVIRQTSPLPRQSGIPSVGNPHSKTQGHTAPTAPTMPTGG